MVPNVAVVLEQEKWSMDMPNLGTVLKDIIYRIFEDPSDRAQVFAILESLIAMILAKHI